MRRPKANYNFSRLCRQYHMDLLGTEEEERERNETIYINEKRWSSM